MTPTAKFEAIIGFSIETIQQELANVWSPARTTTPILEEAKERIAEYFSGVKEYDKIRAELESMGFKFTKHKRDSSYNPRPNSGCVEGCAESNPLVIKVWRGSWGGKSQRYGGVEYFEFTSK